MATVPKFTIKDGIAKSQLFIITDSLGLQYTKTENRSYILISKLWRNSEGKLVPSGDFPTTKLLLSPQVLEKLFSKQEEIETVIKELDKAFDENNLCSAPKQKRLKK